MSGYAQINLDSFSLNTSGLMTSPINYVEPKVIGLFDTPIYMTESTFTRPMVNDVYMANELEYRKGIYGTLLKNQLSRYQHVLNPKYIL